MAVILGILGAPACCLIPVIRHIVRISVVVQFQNSASIRSDRVAQKIVGVILIIAETFKFLLVGFRYLSSPTSRSILGLRSLSRLCVAAARQILEIVLDRVRGVLVRRPLGIQRDIVGHRDLGIRLVSFSSAICRGVPPGEGIAGTRETVIVALDGGFTACGIVLVIRDTACTISTVPVVLYLVGLHFDVRGIGELAAADPSIATLGTLSRDLQAGIT